MKIPTIKDIWHFIWEDNSIWSWIVNILLAFVLIKFAVYPLLSLMLGTSHPIVAVVSSSMEHGNLGFEPWWEKNKEWYTTAGIAKEDFSKYSLKNCFNKGDIIILLGKQPKDIKRGDIIVFRSGRPDPIIHRVVAVNSAQGKFVFSTKGDNNKGQLKDFYTDETAIYESQVIGIAAFKVPYLGYVKILSVNLVCTFYPFRFCIP